MNRLLIIAIAAFTLTQPVLAQQPTFFHVQYGEHFRNNLDVYLPGSQRGPFALVVYIHGGGWLVGDKSEVQPYVQPLHDRGFAVAAMNYRYSYQAPFPAQIHDCKAAIRHLRGNAAEFNIDPSKVAVFGESAGGHLAALIGTASNVAALEGDIGWHLNESSAVLAVGDFSGPTDMFELGTVPPHDSPSSIVSQLFNYPIAEIIANAKDPEYADLVALVNSANPATHASSDDPPFSIAHGLSDDLIPYSQSTLLHDALLNTQVASELHLLPDLGHELPLEVFLPTFDFFVQQLNRKECADADLNCDQTVNVDDLVILLGAWGLCPQGTLCTADLNGDGIVNVDDLVMLLGSWR